MNTERKKIDDNYCDEVQKLACVYSEEAWSLSPLNVDSIRALRQKYPDIEVAIFCAEFDSPAFKQQARAYFEVLWLCDTCNQWRRQAGKL